MDKIKVWLCETKQDLWIKSAIFHESDIIIEVAAISYHSSHITLHLKTGCPLKLSRVEPGQYQDGRPPGKTRLLLEEVLVRPAGGSHPVVCVGPNAPV